VEAPIAASLSVPAVTDGAGNLQSRN